MTKDLIYKDKRLVNWDPKFHTAISDLEVQQREVKGHLWHIEYEIDGAAWTFRLPSPRPGRKPCSAILQWRFMQTMSATKI